MILFTYLMRRFLVSFAMLFAGLSLFYVLVDMVELARRLASANLSFVQLLGVSALNLPQGMYEILPLVVILSALTLFLSMARTSELVAIRASGRSALRMLVGPICAALLIGLVGIALMNPIAASTTRLSSNLVADYLGRGPSALSIGQDGLWLRQGGATEQVVIHASSANEARTEYKDVTFFGINENGAPNFRLEAKIAQLGEGHWTLFDVARWKFSSDTEFQRENVAVMELATELTLEDILDGVGSPSSISIWDLPSFVARLKAAGFSARRHEVWLQTELSQPIMLVGMVLIAAAFTLRHGRFGQTGSRVLIALALGFGFYFIRNLAVVLGENGQLSVFAAAWLPPLAPILLALGILLHLEDG